MTMRIAGNHVDAEECEAGRSRKVSRFILMSRIVSRYTSHPAPNTSHLAPHTSHSNAMFSAMSDEYGNRYPIRPTILRHSRSRPLENVPALVARATALSLNLTTTTTTSSSSCSRASALHHAAFCGQAAVISFLIGSGIRPDVKNSVGLSPLHYAAIGCDV